MQRDEQKRMSEEKSKLTEQKILRAKTNEQRLLQEKMDNFARKE